MLKARKANRVVRIDDTKADEYRAEGYTIMDMQGNVLLTPHDDKLRIKELEQENAQLRAQITALTTKTEGKKPGKEKQ